MLELVKRVLSRHPSALGWVRRGYLASGLGRTRIEDDYLFDLFRRRGRDVVLLQVGANDGHTSDPIWRYVIRFGWRGICLEPVPYLFDRLRETYRNLPRLVLVNAALAERDGQAHFYRLQRSPELPDWAEGLGSFRRDILLSHASSIPNIDRHIVEETVRCVTFSTLMEENKVERLDLIVIDTEGYDLEILRQIDFRRFPAELLIYEQLHLSAIERAEAEALLVSHGYEVHPILNANVAAIRADLEAVSKKGLRARDDSSLSD